VLELYAEQQIGEFVALLDPGFFGVIADSRLLTHGSA
jgi:hypothetical protein